MKKCGIYLGLLLAAGSLFGVVGYAQNRESYSSALQKNQQCALCGDGKESLKSIYRDTEGIGLLCLNDWRVVKVLMPEEGQLECSGMSYMNSKEGDYSVQIEHVVEHKISLVDYRAGKQNRPDMDKLSKTLCGECLQKVQEAVTIQGEHGKRQEKAVCMVEFPAMELYSVQQSFQYYVLGEYYVQAECKKKEIQVTVFQVSSGEDGEFSNTL